MKSANCILALALLLIASLLISCSANTITTEAITTGIITTEADTTVASTLAPANDEPATVDVNGEKPVLKMLVPYAANLDINNNICAKDAEEVTGYIVDYTMLPADNAEEKLYLELAGGSRFDILRLIPGWYYKLVAQGALLPITELLNDYGKDILAAGDPDNWKMTSLDGIIYGIPYTNERPNIQNTMGVRGDVLTSLGLEIPTTVDELYNVYKKVKDDTGMIPFTTTQGDYLIPTISSGFGLYSGSGAYMHEYNGELVFNFKHPYFKDYLEFMRMLYAEGLLDTDWALNQGSIRDEKFTSGKAFSTSYSWYDATRLKPALLNTVSGSSIVLLPPLMNDSGENGVVMTMSLGYAVCIPKVADSPEHAMNWMNIKQQPENFLYLNLGTEGEHYTVSDNKYAPIMPVFTEKRGDAYAYITSKDDVKMADMWLARVWRDPSLGEAFTEMNTDVSFGRVNPAWDMPQLPSVTQYITSATAPVGDGIVKIIIGEEDMGYLDSLLADFDEQGGLEMEKEINEWYASNK